MNSVKEQITIGSAFSLSGVGLHSGAKTTVRVTPATAGSGRYFVRLDLPEKPIIPAQVGAVQQTVLSTELGCGTAKVRTVEHLLASLVATGVDNARIEIDGGEVPLLDGSAKPWMEAILRAGMVNTSEKKPAFVVNEPIWVREKDSFVAAIPAPQTCFSYGIDFKEVPIGNQWHSWTPATENFAQTIAPARTFVLTRQIEQLRQAGMIKGGSLDNALVCDEQDWLNPPLRFANEPARHKLLDLVGDLSLLGTIPQAHFFAYKASHKLHVQLARKLEAVMG